MYFFYYIPVGLDVRLRRRSVITYFLAALCVTVFLIYKFRPVGPFWNVTNLIFLPGNPLVFSAITHAFVHGSVIHLIGNIVYLVIFGRAIEEYFGPARFAAIFAASAIVGAYTHFACVSLFAPDQLSYGVIGASGATSGLLGAYLVRFYYSRIVVAYWVFMPLQGVNRAGRQHLPVIFAIVLWFAFQAIYAVLQFGSGGARVAYALHVGGFGAGAALSILFGGLGKSRAGRHLDRARRHFESANWFGAQGEYFNYLAREPRDAEIHAETARACVCGSLPDRARRHYGESARLFLERGERDGAESVFIEAMRGIPGFLLPYRLHLDLAYGMERTLKFRGAAAAYENFLSGYPTSDDAPFVLLRMAGIHERRFCDPAAALSFYRRLVESYPGDPWADYARAETSRLERLYERSPSIEPGTRSGAARRPENSLN